MRAALRHATRCLAAIPLTAAVLAGCTASEPITTTTVTTTTTTPTVVTYPEGRYQLYGDGITTAYYWVWIPTGARAVTPVAPPPLPGRVAAPPVITTAPVVTSSEGYYRLYGDGVTTAYYWAWIPAGAPAPPPPPPPPRRG
jgi:hypothetical protein